MKNHFNPLIALLIVLQGCGFSQNFLNRDEVLKREISRSQPFYIGGNYPQPNLLSRKGQVRADAHAGTSSGVNAAYAITDRLTIMGKTAVNESGGTDKRSVTLLFNNGSSEETFTENHTTVAETDMTTQSVEGGLFYTKSFRSFRYEAGGGMNFGEIKNQHRLNIYSAYATMEEKRNYMQYFIQAAGGFIKKRYEAALIARLSSYHFTHREYFTSYTNEPLPYKDGAACFEYGIRMGLRFGRLTLYYQFNSGEPLINDEVKWRLTQHAAGLTLRFGPKHHLQSATP